jgi:hypothetical protein
MEKRLDVDMENRLVPDGAEKRWQGYAVLVLAQRRWTQRSNHLTLAEGLIITAV